MGTNSRDSSSKLLSAFRAFVHEASESELDEALRSGGEDPNEVYLRGQGAIDKALRRCPEPDRAEPADDGKLVDQALKDGFSALLRMLRKREGMSREDLAREASVDLREVVRIETDADYVPEPRAVFQLEQIFHLAPRTLVLLSGSVTSHSDGFREEVERFAAKSRGMDKLDRKQKKALNQFVRFLASEAATRS